ncbi:hypothetical protein FA13DRAFT_1739857 [Coprinellus micaceus]|uniref:Uncharacterized protein n=1 Tax=Coprinellus micaceus TaxID=71717 RepID=A0A4Y7SPX3_COPMI|nr:hypothetical protein FA13DRAFT_1739857 [Coprinellus micaceus]
MVVLQVVVFKSRLLDADPPFRPVSLRVHPATSRLPFPCYALSLSLLYLLYLRFSPFLRVYCLRRLRSRY